MGTSGPEAVCLHPGSPSSGTAGLTPSALTHPRESFSPSVENLGTVLQWEVLQQLSGGSHGFCCCAYVRGGFHLWRGSPSLTVFQLCAELVWLWTFSLVGSTCVLRATECPIVSTSVAHASQRSWRGHLLWSDSRLPGPWARLLFQVGTAALPPGRGSWEKKQAEKVAALEFFALHPCEPIWWCSLEGVI